MSALAKNTTIDADITKLDVLFLQLLFGRYRDQQSTVKPLHLVVLAAVLIVVVFVYVRLLRKRLALFSRNINSIPKKTFPIVMDTRGKKSKGYGMMLEQTLVAYEFNRAIRPMPLAPTHSRDVVGGVRGDPGAKDRAHELGKGEVQSSTTQDPYVVNFNRSIAESYQALETIVRRRRPGLVCSHDRTIRDYVCISIQKAFPKLTLELCEVYIEWYEKAVFNQTKLHSEDFAEFCKVFEEIKSTIIYNVQLLSQDENDHYNGRRKSVLLDLVR